MFNAQYISSKAGVSKKNVNYYMIEIIANTVTGNAKVAQLFCTETAFNSAKTLRPMQPCKVLGGVDDNGHLTIANIKADIQN